MRRLLLLLLKAAISILLFYLSLRSVNLGVVGERLSRINSSWVAAALLMLAVQVALGALRWRKIVAVCGVRLAFIKALRINLIAIFFSQVLPSTVGGDAARIWLLGREGGWAIATYSVLIDRIVGVFALALVVIACLPWSLNLVHDPVAWAVLLLIGCGAVAGGLVFITIGFLRWDLFERWVLTRHLVEVSRVTWRLCSSPHSLMLVGALSIAIHLLTIATAWCVVQSIGSPASFAQLLFLVPPVLLIATIPLSIAGWGLRESSMIVAFGYMGLAQSDGLIVSILLGLTTFAIGTIGGITWIASDIRQRALSREREVSPLANDA